MTTLAPKLVLTLLAVLPLAAQTAVTLSPAASPAAGQAGVTSITLTGSGFPAGTILPADTDVKLEPATSGAGATVTTKAATVTLVVGSTRRFAFLLPASIQVTSPTPYLASVSGRTTTGAAFASTNKATLTVNPPARILSLSPNTGAAGQTVPVTITGQFTNFVQGSTQANCGAGISVGDAAEGTLGPVTVTSATTATAQLKIDTAAAAGLRDVTVRTGVQQATLAGGFTVTSGAGPVISDFNPKSAPAGTLVTVTGSNLAPNPQVTLNRQGGGAISAPVASASATSLSFTVPTGADTGLLTVTVNSKPASSTVPLTIVASKDFTLSALPGTADLIQGQSVSFAVRLASTTGFSQLAALSLSGVPSGITAALKPQSITAGQTSVLTLTAPTGQALGNASLTISASANVEGIPLAQSANATVNVVAPTTTFMGRTVVDDPLQTPLAGVTVTMLGKDGNGGTTACSGTAVSDAAGNFALRNLPANCVGRQLVGFDGLTATSPPGKYAGVNLVYTLVSGQVTVSPVLVHLPRIDDKETFYVQQNAPNDQSYAYKSIPGLSLIVYRNTTLTLPDGTQPNPFPLVAVQVPVDRLPDSKPPVPTMMLVFIVAFQPANARASQPVAVFYPNTLNTAPGVNMTLMTLDPTRGAMVPYGTGTVSADGTQVIPDLDPAFPLRRYGIVNFDWHGQMPPPPDPETNPSPDPGGGGECSPTPESPKSGFSSAGGGCGGGVADAPAEGDPVDLATGLMVYNVPDLTVSGNRGTIQVRRIYRSTTVLALTVNRPFGPNTNHNYNYALGMAAVADPAQITLINPDNSRVPFARQADGTYVNTTVKTAVGSVLRRLAGGRFDLRSKNGNVMEFEADGATVARLTGLVDPNGNRIVIERNTANRVQVLSVTDPVGRQIRFTYDANNRITRLTDPIGRTVTYTYYPTGPGMLATVTDPEGGVTRYEYQDTSLVREFNTRNIKVHETVYQGSIVAQQTQADGGVYRFYYQPFNILSAGTSPIQSTTVVNPNGRRTTYRFDPSGQLLQVTHQDETLRYADTDARPAEGKARIFTVQPFPKRVTQVTGDAQCSTCGNARAGAVDNTFDALGNLTSRRNALGQTTAFEHEPVYSRLKAATDALGNRSEMSYDSRGNLVSARDARGNTTTYQYNAFGQVTEIANPLGHKTKFEYDAFGNMVAVIDALGNKTSFRYDAVSRLVETVDPLGRRVRTFYDSLDRVTKRIDGRGVVAEFAYDPAGNLLTLTDGRGKSTTFTYDSMNRLATRTDPLGKTDFRVYDPLGNLVRFTDRRGQVSEFRYDIENRLIEEKYQDALVKRWYDTAGRLVRVDDSAVGAFTYSYDAAGRLLTSTGPFGKVNYTRDAVGRVKTRQVVGQPAVTYEYDPAGNMLSAAMSGASVSYTYDARNLPVILDRLNGVSTQYSFDAAGRLLSIVHARGPTVLNTQAYSSNAAGERTSQQTNIAQALITQPSRSTYDDNNRLSSKAMVTFAYDDNGNLNSRISPNGQAHYIWDSRNRLSSIVSGGRNISFVYDYQGTMLQQREDNITRTFVVDELTNVVSLTGTATGEPVSILSGQRIDSHFATSRTSGPTEYGLVDIANSTVMTVDSVGFAGGRFTYEPFGQTTTSGASFPFLYTGRSVVLDDLYYYRARFYDSQMGRFVSEDPLGMTGTTANLYAYAGNSPLVFMDPEGLSKVDVSSGTARLDVSSGTARIDQFPAYGGGGFHPRRTVTEAGWWAFLNVTVDWAWGKLLGTVHDLLEYLPIRDLVPILDRPFPRLSGEKLSGEFCKAKRRVQDPCMLNPEDPACFQPRD